MSGHFPPKTLKGEASQFNRQELRSLASPPLFKRKKHPLWSPEAVILGKHHLSVLVDYTYGTAQGNWFQGKLNNDVCQWTVLSTEVTRHIIFGCISYIHI